MFIGAYENIDRRGIGDKRAGNKHAPSSDLTLADIDVKYRRHGKKEPFATSKLDSDGSRPNHVPRWFQLGDDTVDVGIQLAMVREIMGTHRRLDDTTKERRGRVWKDWALGVRSQEVRQYVDTDIRDIVFRHQDQMFGLVIGEEDGVESHMLASADDISYRELGSWSSTLREVLVMSNAYPSRSTRSLVDAAPTSTTSPRKKRAEAGESNESTGSRPDAKRTCTPWPHLSSYDGKALPEAFRMHRLREKIACEGTVGLVEVARFEHALLGVRDGKSAAIINCEIMALECDLLDRDDIETMQNMSGTDLSNALRNMHQLKMEIAAGDTSCGDLFLPGDEQSLLSWTSEGRRYSRGERLPVKLMVKTPNASRELTDAASHCSRHAIFCYDLSTNKFNGLLQSFSVMLLGRPLEDEEFPSIDTLRNHIERLRLIDLQQFFQKVLVGMGDKTKNGFVRQWYSQTDDSKFNGNDKRHVGIASFDRGDGTIEGFDPVNQVFTAGRAGLSNTDLNLTSIKNDIPSSLHAQYGGNMSDNANDAIAEGGSTFEGLLETLDEDEQILYGVGRKVIQATDGFHIVNLMCNAAATEEAGPRDQGFDTRHRTCHPLQLEQNIYDIHHENSTLSQHAANEILEGSGNKYHMHPMKERSQRWGVNQENARAIVEGHELSLPTDPDDPDRVATFWTRYGRYMHHRSSGWQRDACSDIIMDSLKPDVIASLYYQQELGRFYQSALKWNAENGEIATRPGYRTLEVHQYWLDFAMPFWNEAADDPTKSAFRKAFEYLGQIEEQEIVDKMRERFIDGIEAARDEMNKMMNRLLSPPLVFLMLSHPNRGTDLLNAAAFLFREMGDSLGDGFKEIVSEDAMTEGEKMYYDLLRLEKDDSLHFFKQIGLARDCVRDDLKRLSNEQQNTRDVKSDTPLADFRKQYPIIFEALFATFALLPSSSRLSEQVHGLMRATLGSETPIGLQDHKMAYITRNEYDNRKERRGIVLERMSSGGDESKRSLKHEDRKETQKMVGVQLKESLKQYSLHAINSLPSDASESIRISKIQEIGLKTKEADAKKKAVEKSDLKARKAKSQPPSLSSWLEKAKKRKLANDGNRKSKEERQRDKDLELVMTKSYWSKIKVNGPGGREPLYREVENVLPHLVVPDLRTKTKGKLVDLVYAHVKAVVGIGKGEANGITDDSLEGKSKGEIYRHFFKPEKSDLLDAVKQERKKRHDTRNALIASCGTGSIDSKYWVEMEFDEISD